MLGYRSEVLADNPKGFWLLDEISGLPQDSSGNGNHMTAVFSGGHDYRRAGPITGSYGIWMQGGRFFTLSPTPCTVTNNFSMEFWFTHEAGDGDSLFYNGFHNNRGWGEWIYNSTTRGFLYGGVAFQTAIGFPDVNWHQVVYVRDSGVTKNYLDGNLVNGNAGTDTPVSPSGGDIRIGSTGNVQGIWSLCSIYETALSPTRIAAHYAATQVDDIVEPDLKVYYPPSIFRSRGG
jgi:hypothetical protein